MQTKILLIKLQELNKFQEREINFIKGSKKNLVLLMIGGNSKRYKPKNCDYYYFSSKILEATKNLDCKLLVLLSRRTPLKAAKILNYSFLKHNENFQIVTSSEQNPYPEILQIADYKLFYLPYFSHYGVKAPRQRGFLTPSIEFEIANELSETTTSEQEDSTVNLTTREDINEYQELSEAPDQSCIAVSYTHLTLPTNREV